MKRGSIKMFGALVLVATLAFTTSNDVFAWNTIIYGFDHGSRYGGEAENGNRAGNVEYAGSERRVRAGAEYIYYTAAQIYWNQVNYYPAFVFHINTKNGTGDSCTNIRTVYGWNWSNLPSVNPWPKGCGGIPGTFGGNEIRFYYSAWGVSPSTTYYAQSLYKDIGYNGTPASKAQGEINFDSYATDVFNVTQRRDNHGKVCVAPDFAYTPGAGGAC